MFRKTMVASSVLAVCLYAGVSLFAQAGQSTQPAQPQNPPPPTQQQMPCGDMMQGQGMAGGGMQPGMMQGQGMMGSGMSANMQAQMKEHMSKMHSEMDALRTDVGKVQDPALRSAMQAHLNEMSQTMANMPCPMMRNAAPGSQSAPPVNPAK